MSVIEASGLSRHFGRLKAASDVSFALAEGEAVGFLGRNGAGKTTTLRMLAGTLIPSGGHARIHGHDIVSDPIAARARIGWLPEDPPLYRDMRVRDFLRFCGRLRSLRAALSAARTDEVLEALDIAGLAGRLIGRLSRGERQRVGLAQALVHDPDVLLLDEPTSALDPAQLHDARRLLKELAASERPSGGRRAVILSTHRLEDVLATCSRVLVLASGRLVADEAVGPGVDASALERRFLELTTPDAAPC